MLPNGSDTGCFSCNPAGCPLLPNSSDTGSFKLQSCRLPQVAKCLRYRVVQAVILQGASICQMVQIQSVSSCYLTGCHMLPNCSDTGWIKLQSYRLPHVAKWFRYRVVKVAILQVAPCCQIIQIHVVLRCNPVVCPMLPNNSDTGCFKLSSYWLPHVAQWFRYRVFQVTGCSMLPNGSDTF